MHYTVILSRSICTVHISVSRNFIIKYTSTTFFSIFISKHSKYHFESSFSNNKLCMWHKNRTHECWDIPYFRGKWLYKHLIVLINLYFHKILITDNTDVMKKLPKIENLYQVKTIAISKDKCQITQRYIQISCSTPSLAP